MRRVWMTLGSYGMVVLGGCAATRPEAFKPDITVRGPPGHPPGQNPHHRRQFWDALDPFIPPDGSAGPPAGLPGLAPAETKRKPLSEFVIPDASLMFGRPENTEQKP
ncbi:hypothetical protein CGLAMM_10555 [Acetobacteraceae bacterium EV16G]|uniref:Lipoprotein n=2 Tax=Sorlinia euscelidii TaxID=3081148 RepID=A0ABU7U198_9PROT